MWEAVGLTNASPHVNELFAELRAWILSGEGQAPLAGPRSLSPDGWRTAAAANFFAANSVLLVRRTCRIRPGCM